MGKEIVKQTTLEHGASVIGVGVGVGAATAIGTVVGSTGLLGTIGSCLGLTIATTTPVGWLIAGGFAGGAALKYGSRIIGKKGESDGKAAAMEAIISERNQKRMERIASKLAQMDVALVMNLFKQVRETDNKYDDLLDQIKEGVEQGAVPPNEAMSIACEILGLPVDDYLHEDKITIEELNFAVLISVIMMNADGSISNEEIDVLIESISKKFAVSIDDAEFVLNQQLDHCSTFQKSVKNYFPLQVVISIAKTFKDNKRIMRIILELLIVIAEADDNFDESEKVVYATVYNAFNMGFQYSQYERLIHDFPFRTTKIAGKNNVFLRNDVNFSKKLQGVLAEFATGVIPDHVLCLYLDSKWGKRGFVVTDMGVIRDDGEIIFFNQIRSASFDESAGTITISTDWGIFCLLCKSGEMAEYLDGFGRIKEVASLANNVAEIELPDCAGNMRDYNINRLVDSGAKKLKELKNGFGNKMVTVKSEMTGAKGKVESRWKDTSTERQEIKKSASRLIKKVFKR